MAQLLRLREAARQLRVSPSKLYRAIADGRLTAELGGGPGKPTLISVEALDRYAVSEGLIPQGLVPTSGQPDTIRLEDLERLPIVETVYVLQYAEYYKIGRTQNLSRRLQTLQTALPLPVTVIHQLETAASAGLEQYLHERFQNVRISGEWFQLSQDDIAWIQSIAQWPPEASERLERLPPAAIMERLERLDEMFAGMQRLEQLMAQVLARLERSEHPGGSTAGSTVPTAKAALLDRLRAMRADGHSLQAMADRLNHEGMPTLSGKGRWQKGTISNLLQQQEKKDDLTKG